MRAIIVATGRAPRLLPLSKDTPACMLEVGGTSILARQVECLRSVGVDDIMIVVGGVIPPQDFDALKEAGAAAIFPPGTVIAEAAAELLENLLS